MSFAGFSSFIDDGRQLLCQSDLQEIAPFGVVAAMKVAAFRRHRGIIGAPRAAFRRVPGRPRTCHVSPDG
jgi:hypothetical protein